MFMVTHDVDAAILLSDRIALMTSSPEMRFADDHHPEEECVMITRTEATAQILAAKKAWSRFQCRTNSALLLMALS